MLLRIKFCLLNIEQIGRVKLHSAEFLLFGFYNKHNTPWADPYILIFLSQVENSDYCGTKDDVRDELEDEISADESKEHIFYCRAKAVCKSPFLNSFKEEHKAAYKEHTRVDYGAYDSRGKHRKIFVLFFK